MHVEREKVEQNTWWWPKSDTNYDNMTLTCFKLSNMSFIENLQKLFCLYIKTEDWIEYASSIWANILRGEAKFGVEKIFFAPILKYILTCCFWVEIEVSFGKCCVEGRNKTIKKYRKRMYHTCNALDESWQDENWMNTYCVQLDKQNNFNPSSQHDSHFLAPSKVSMNKVGIIIVMRWCII